MAIDLYNLVLTAKIQKGGGGPSVEVEPLSVTENGTYSASSGHAYSPVEVSVPTGVFPSGTSSITSNGIYDITNFASVDVNVSGGGGGGSGDKIIAEGLTIEATESITSLPANVFRSFVGLTEAIFPNVEDIGNYAFYGCSKLSNISFPNASSIGEGAFQFCSSLQTVSFPNASLIGSYAFSGCSKLTAADFPEVSRINSGAFSACSSLTTVNMPELLSIYGSAFTRCSRLATVSFPKARYIQTNAFNACSSLMSAYFLASSVASLYGTNAFAGTPMSNSTYTGSFGSIYVPASLVDAYKSAMNWMSYSDRITAYEG